MAPAVGRPITSRAELADYLAHERLLCLECGQRYAFLPTHLVRTHGLSSATYRARWGLPAGTPLAGTAYRAAHRETFTRLIDEGRLVRDLPAAVAAATRTGHGQRVAWERAEHGARGRARDWPARAVPSQRQDGRDPARMREYQRAHRALHRGDPEPMRRYRERWGP